MSATLANRVRTLNMWRDNFNPLRGLTIARSVALLEAYVRGEMADLQWTYNFVEQTDADLLALVERRTGAITELDWNIKVVSEDRTPAFDKSLAEDQQAALREAWERIDNVTEAIEHLATASFRGYAHLEKHRGQAKLITHLEVCDQWNVIRDGYVGAWKYNPEARNVTFRSLPDALLIDPAGWIIRETRRHINRIALVKFIRMNLGQKDWDAFVEIYGLPPVIIIGPPNVPESKEAEYQAEAETVAEGGSGYLPNGSTVHTPDSTRGNSPFRDYLQFLTEKLILAGTGGLLTMLTAPTGIGKGPSEEHADVFKTIAGAEAKKISEVLQRQVDREVLDAAFPGKPRLAYFELAADESTDPGEIIDHATKLAAAGWRMDTEELSEKTGYTITAAIQTTDNRPQTTDKELSTEPDPDMEEGHEEERQPATEQELANRSAEPAAALQEVSKAMAEDLQPVFQRLLAILDIEDPEIRAAKLAAWQAGYPQLAKDILADPSAAPVLEQAMTTAMAQGIAKSTAAK